MERLDGVLSLLTGSRVTRDDLEAWIRLNAACAAEEAMMHCFERTHACGLRVCTDSLRGIVATYVSQMNGTDEDPDDVTLLISTQTDSVRGIFLRGGGAACLRQRVLFVLVTIMGFPPSLQVEFPDADGDEAVAGDIVVCLKR